MGRVRTADQVREEYLETMGPGLGPVFSALYNEVAWLHLRWAEYVALFGTNPDRIKLMNAAAGLFFRVVQDSLWEDTLLHLCRITDPPKHGKQARLTLNILPSLVKDENLARETTALIAEAEAKTRFARDWRDRRLAHTSLRLATKQGAKPLAPASRHHVKLALAAIAAVLNRLETHYRDATLHFSPPPDPRGAETLLYVIRDGLNAEEQRQRRLREGRPNEDDLRPPPAI